ncbi:MAG TPA: adenylate/guanylate cyclase domain-containing protein [Jatrophihabitans sp.]|jgi:adenylate cyclase
MDTGRVNWFSHGRHIRREVTRDQVPGLPLVWRTFGGMTGLVMLANIAGGVVVGLLLIALNADASHHQRMVVGLVGAAYGLAAIAFGAVMGWVLQSRTLRWVARGRTPTRDEARRALRNPLDLAVLTGALWILGAVVIAILAANLDANGSEIFGLSGGLVLAGLTTAGVTYTIAASVGRPLATIALRVYPPTESVFLTLRMRMLLSWLLATGIPLLGIILILASPRGRSHIIGAGLFAAVAALVVGVVAAISLSHSIGARLRALVTALERVGRGDLTIAVEVDDMGELGMLQRGINEMVAGLRERERIQDLFGQHVGPAVAEEAIKSGVSLGGGEQRRVVALFVDIVGSTRLTRSAEPSELVAILNRFFGRVVDAVEAHGGLVNKFEGDAALCVFGAPVALDDPSTCALLAAREIRDRVHGDGEVGIGVGVAAGDVIAGQIGAPSRLEYTVVGDAVNEAARLTELAKRVDGNILASEQTVESAASEEQENWAKGKVLRLRGRDAPTHTYRCPVPAPVD